MEPLLQKKTINQETILSPKCAYSYKFQVLWQICVPNFLLSWEVSLLHSIVNLVQLSQQAFLDVGDTQAKVKQS